MNNNERRPRYSVGQKVTDGRTDYYGSESILTIESVRMVNGLDGQFPVYTVTKSGVGGTFRMKEHEMRGL